MTKLFQLAYNIILVISHAQHLAANITSTVNVTTLTQTLAKHQLFQNIVMLPN